jgi:hypothetical protein
MPAKRSLQYTIRGVPPDVDKALRRRARQRGISLNRLLIEELCAAGGVGEPRRYRSLEGIAGRWQDDPEFDRILDEQRQIDPELWK